MREGENWLIGVAIAFLILLLLLWFVVPG